MIQQFAARTPDQFEKFWKKQVFSGKGAMPEVFKTEAELVVYVSRTPGAFGYVDDSTPTSGVSVVRLQN